MNNDLISRSELKKALHNFFDGKVVDEPTYILRDVFYYIDNAPTVETNILFLCDHKKCGENFNCFECNHTSDIRHAINFDLMEFPRSVFVERARPQDRWGKWSVSEIQCPNCLEYFQTDCYSTEELNKCPICNAKMRGGVEHGSNDR